MQKKLTSTTTLENLKKKAKRWLKALRENDAAARERLQHAYPTAPDKPVLRDVQYALAREYGQNSWKELKQALQVAALLEPLATGVPTPAPSSPARTAEEFERLAQDFVNAYEGDAAALQRLNQHYGRSFTFDDLWAEIWRRVYAFRQRSFRVPKNYLQLEEAQIVIAQDAGFGNWTALMQAASGGAQPPVEAFEIDAKENSIGPRRRMTDTEWDELIATIKERRIAGVDANGLMTESVLARLAGLDHVTRLNLGGSRELTDDGLLHLARMPQLEHLDLSEHPGGKLTHRGLEVLRHLPTLRPFEMTWQAGISDAGVANLRFCDRLERVNLMGSPTGDGAIQALQGKTV